MKLVVITGPEVECGVFEWLGVEEGRGKKYEDSKVEATEDDDGGAGKSWFCEFGAGPDDGVGGGIKKNEWEVWKQIKYAMQKKESKRWMDANGNVRARIRFWNWRADEYIKALALRLWTCPWIVKPRGGTPDRSVPKGKLTVKVWRMVWEKWSKQSGAVTYSEPTQISPGSAVTGVILFDSPLVISYHRFYSEYSLFRPLSQLSQWPPIIQLLKLYIRAEFRSSRATRPQSRCLDVWNVEQSHESFLSVCVCIFAISFSKGLVSSSHPQFIFSISVRQSETANVQSGSVTREHNEWLTHTTRWCSIFDIVAFFLLFVFTSGPICAVVTSIFISLTEHSKCIFK